MLNHCSLHVIVRSGGAAKIQRLSGGGLNPNGDRTDEVGVKSTRDGWGSEVYTMCGDAVVPLRRVMRCLCGSGPHLSRYSTYPSALPVCATVRQDVGGFVVLSKGFRKEGLRVVVVFAQLLHSGR